MVLRGHWQPRVDLDLIDELKELVMEKRCRAIELAYSYLKVPEITRGNTRVHLTQPLKERVVREVGYGLSVESASAADLVKSMQATAKGKERQPCR